MKTATPKHPRSAANASRLVRPNRQQTDFISNGKAFGSVASRLIQGGLKLNSLRTNTLLNKDEWIEFDTRVIDIARQRLVGVEDLRSFGLVKTLGGIGTLISQYEKASDMSAANVDMSGVARGDKDSVGFTLVSVPVPVVHKDFEINLRRLMASRKVGDSIDTTQATTAGRRVADKFEDMLFNGLTGNLDGNALYGYTSHPSTNTGTADGDFATIANIFSSINAMVAALENDNHQGPFVLYCHTNQFAQMRAVYTDGSGQSAMTRIKANIPSIREIKTSQSLTDGQLVLVEMTEDTVDLAMAEDVTTVEWAEMGGMISQFKVMLVGAARVKADANGNCGVAFYTGS